MLPCYAGQCTGRLFPTAAFQAWTFSDHAMVGYAVDLSEPCGPARRALRTEPITLDEWQSPWGNGVEFLALLRSGHMRRLCFATRVSRFRVVSLALGGHTLLPGNPLLAGSALRRLVVLSLWWPCSFDVFGDAVLAQPYA